MQPLRFKAEPAGLSFRWMYTEGILWGRISGPNLEFHDQILPADTGNEERQRASNTLAENNNCSSVFIFALPFFFTYSIETEK